MSDNAQIIRNAYFLAAKSQSLKLLERAKPHWENQPRVPAGSPEGGQFGESNGGVTSPELSAALLSAVELALSESNRPTIGQSTGSAKANERVKTVIDAIPAAHAEAIKDYPVRIVRSSTAFMEDDNDIRGLTWQGMFSYNKETGKVNGIYIAETAPFLDTTTGKLHDIEISNISKNTAHELGHAYDHFTKGEASRKLGKEMLKGLKSMKPREKKAAIKQFEFNECFAELYALAHNPNKGKDQRYFGNMTRKRAETVFAEALAKVKAL